MLPTDIMSLMPSSPTVNVVIQARASSTRLPGKVLRELGGLSVLGWVIRAARATRGVDDVVVATSDGADDDAVAEEARRHGAEVVRGPLDDVLARFLLACEEHPADAVVRLTADCPLHDPALLAQVVGMWRAEPALDYVSTTLQRTLPRGFDAELVRVPVLVEQAERPEGPHREHVTYGVANDVETYACAGVVVAPRADDLRVTLDTEDDWALLDALVHALSRRHGTGPFAWRDVVALLRERADLVALNAHVEQKEVAA
ncbi:spore coat polysaccharide biosynthesis protein F, CMP-KDO synthetase [Saccharomonospora azurea NA-128]|uniref:Spore coat polysaccharide biosynthesis protein F, CMP-KDO synthetase n=2 Tax=Saccharomonospora azurea TaxID=40988 RepID=H8GCL9_9PSEU|nr:spore coat polysaccharide biosynthesis protein F, CMP-KDO synthetase [Saccharomonospora azurea SZMC 14600]EHY89827.1 spore coat polysaccharide biosynthesis protein F, CMP-KDO synthetase [Saccharomonospora azurea NA-128]